MLRTSDAEVGSTAQQGGTALGLVPEREQDNLQPKQIREGEHPRARAAGTRMGPGVVHASESDTEELVSEMPVLSHGVVSRRDASASGMESAGSHASFSSDTSFCL